MGGFAIDYEHDSEEVVALKKHIANQGISYSLYTSNNK